MIKIKTALISTYNKEGIVEFASKLREMGIDIISSGGTYKKLRENNIEAREVCEITKFQECLDGRVKTLHPNIHAGILADRTKKSHMDTLDELKIDSIDMVVVNLYPFEQVINNPNHSLKEAIENIDIGGPSLIRAAAKNHEGVLVVTDPNTYDEVLERIANNKVDIEFRRKLALKAFTLTAKYDMAISNYFNKVNENSEFPENILLCLNKKSNLRYGENPHQKAAYYNCKELENPSIESAKFLHGKELSYNNYNDSQGAIDLALEFDEPVCVAVKHSTPCSVATDENIYKAYTRAYETDPLSIFGGIVCFNRVVDEDTATELNKIFLEVVIAPGFDEKALEILKGKKNIRLLELESLGRKQDKNYLNYKSVGRGFLVQENNNVLFPEGLSLATNKEPSEKEMEDLKFAMTVVKHVKSNAIVVVKDKRTIGVAGGDVSRIFAAQSALKRADEFDTNGAVLASDAFFPFDDVVRLSAKYNISSIIQPSGSKNDQLSIDACNENNISMVFTNKIRHFRH